MDYSCKCVVCSTWLAELLCACRASPKLDLYQLTAVMQPAKMMRTVKDWAAKFWFLTQHYQSLST